MNRFEFQTADTVTAAVTLLTERPDAALLGGGTNLVDLMKLGVEKPGTIVDVTHLGMSDVEEIEGGALRIGAGVRNSELAANTLVRQRFPVLSEALLAGASGQLRNMATTAGNLLQRTRCLYFQDVSKPCNKREPGTGCPAISGEHRNLAILGASDSCIATHPSDMAVAMTALDAVVLVEGPTGTREVPIDELYRLPGSTPQLEHTLAHDEIITAVRLPALPAESVWTYRKVRDRASYAFALASVAVVLTVDDGLVGDVRIGLGGVAGKPWRARRAEDVLRGAPATAQSYERAAVAELSAANPLARNAYKVPLMRRLLVDTLGRLADTEEPA